MDAQRKSDNNANVSPIIATPHHYLISIHRSGLFFVAVTTGEIPPLFVIEFLHRVVDNFIDYFNDCTESALKEHIVVVYELLDEMLDNGFPLATESNILKELIKPPNFLRTITNTISGRNKLVHKIMFKRTRSANFSPLFQCQLNTAHWTTFQRSLEEIRRQVHQQRGVL